MRYSTSGAANAVRYSAELAVLIDRIGWSTVSTNSCINDIQKVRRIDWPGTVLIV